MTTLAEAVEWPDDEVTYAEIVIPDGTSPEDQIRRLIRDAGWEGEVDMTDIDTRVYKAYDVWGYTEDTEDQMDWRVEVTYTYEWEEKELATLTVGRDADTWTVRDDCGGVWRPHVPVNREIETAEQAKLMAVRYPMRGWWSS